MRTGVLILAVACALAASSCSATDCADMPCQGHEWCLRGEYCATNGKCVRQECDSLDGCEAEGAVCLADLGLCSARECGQDELECQEGSFCQAGTCLPEDDS